MPILGACQQAPVAPSQQTIVDFSTGLRESGGEGRKPKEREEKKSIPAVNSSSKGCRDGMENGSPDVPCLKRLPVLPFQNTGSPRLAIVVVVVVFQEFSCSTAITEGGLISLHINLI